mmetsp:Transcript_40577/g.75548  ORF Transcript_40577/g.75548 Transcript_40577/m.75548 type:complete len:412 (-) Transcript_40577:75-1310(-)
MHRPRMRGLLFWPLQSLLLLPVLRALRPPSDGPLETEKDKVLYFSPVGPSFRDLTKKNVQHLYSSGFVHVFLAHYRRDLEEWRKEDWYNQAVRFSVSYRASKPTYVLNELVNHQTFRLSGYRWFWIADDNIDFTHLNVARYLGLATESGANIVQPAVEFDSHGIPSHEIVLAYSAPVELANHSLSRSLYRYTDFVEVMSPMFSPAALEAAWKLYLPGLRSDFGMDQVWCRYVAAQLQSPVNRSCVIVDAEPMFKMPHIQSYNVQDALAAEEVVERIHPEYRQRSLDTWGYMKTGVTQMCRTADNATLVPIGPRSWVSKMGDSWKFIVAYFRCKLGYSFMAECHTDWRMVIWGVVLRVIAVVAILSFPLLVLYLFRQILMLTGFGQSRAQADFAQKRIIRAPYRQRPWTEGN